MSPSGDPASRDDRSKRHLGLGKKIIFSCVACFLLICFIEGFLQFCFFPVDYFSWRKLQFTLNGDDQARIAQYDPWIGWVSQPGFESEDYFSDGIDVHINRQGFRGNQIYLKEIPNGQSRMICLGDSFTFGHGVGDFETWPEILESQTGIPAINMGMLGYGIDQAYLVYLRHGASFEHDIVILALITDDFRRLLMDRSGTGFFKPKFKLIDDELIIPSTPLPKPLARGSLIYPMRRREFQRDHLSILRVLIPKPQESQTLDYGRLERPEESQPLGQAIIRDLNELCELKGKRFLVVWLPVLAEYQSSSAKQLQKIHLSAFQSFAEEEEIEFLDLTKIFEGETPEQIEAHFLPEQYHHPNGETNQLFAELISSKIKNYELAWTPVHSPMQSNQ